MVMEFNGSGSGQHVDLGTLDLPGGLSALTILAWCKFKSFTIGDQRIISKATSHDIPDHWFMFSGLNSNQMRVRLKTGGTTTTHVEDSATINLNQWYHMGFVYTGSNILFYRDGQQNGADSKSGTMDTSGSVEVRIADNPGINRKELDGYVEDCRIYTRALSQAEIQTIHTARGKDVIVYGLQHRWLLNEGYDGQTASGAGLNKDLTGRVNGTPAASPVFRSSPLMLRG
jgi:hypothetical protein